MTLVLAIDATLPETGPMQFARGWHTKGVLPNKGGVIGEGSIEQGDFESVHLQRGDMVLFDSHTPSRSEKNASTTLSQRLAFLTYNAASEGYLHEAYYEEKARVMREKQHSGSGLAPSSSSCVLRRVTCCIALRGDDAFAKDASSSRSRHI
jgi:hypothetical protein